MVPTLHHAFARGHLPTVAVLRAFGGPFESLGGDALIVLCIVIVSALEFLGAYWLWHASRDGAVLGLILLGLIPTSGLASLCRSDHR